MGAIVVSVPAGLVNLRMDRKELGLTGRQFQDAKRGVFAAMGREWHETYLRRHFQEDATARYGYTRRKGSGRSPGEKGFASTYAGRKLRRFGHARPLVFTGEGERLAQMLDLRVSSSQSRVVLPRKFNFKNPKSRVDMRAELTRVLQPEADEISQVGATTLGREVDEILNQQT